MNISNTNLPKHPGLFLIKDTTHCSFVNTLVENCSNNQPMLGLPSM